MKDWNELKQQYEQIPVPAEARERIKMGIAQAEQEQKTEKKSAPSLIWIKRTGATAAASLVLITALANISPQTAQAMENIPVIGAIAQIVTFRTYEHHTENTEALIEVPQIQGNAESPSANAEIQAYADQLIATYEQELQASQEAGSYALHSVYDVVFENSRYLCIRIRTTMTIASRTEFVKIFTINKNSGETVSLKALLGNDSAKLEAISENIKDQMRQQMAQDDSLIYFLDSDHPQEDFQELTGEESYYFNSQGQLVIAFDEYQVAPGYMGAVEFTIPEQISGDLSS